MIIEGEGGRGNMEREEGGIGDNTIYCKD